MEKQINALTATRGFAAIMVVIFHFSGNCFPFNIFPTFFNHGALAVSYFFVLSGFVLYTVYKEKSISYGAYMKRRIARIVPLYLAALLLSIAAYYFIYNNAFAVSDIRLIAAHALLLQAYIPGYSMYFNVPGWTLSVEMSFYLLFPQLLVLFKSRPRLFIILTISLFIISQALHLYYYPFRDTTRGNAVDLVIFSPVIHLNQFLIGMCGGYLFGKMGAPQRWHKWLLVLSAAAVLLLMNFLPLSISCQAGLIAPVFMLFIVSVGISNPAFMTIRPLVFLGEISYGIYILQLPVDDYLVFFYHKYMLLPRQVFFYFFLCVLIFIAAISYYFFEKPIIKKVAGSR